MRSALPAIRITGSRSVRSARCVASPGAPAVATWCSSGVSCGRRSGTCGPTPTTLPLVLRFIRLFRGGDSRLLSGVASIFEEQGFRVLGAHDVAPQILMPEGPLGRYQPSAADQDDIAQGLAFLRATGPFDVGQAVVVARRRVLASRPPRGPTTCWRGLPSCGRRTNSRGRRRSRQGAEARPGPADRSADDRTADDRGRRACGAGGRSGGRGQHDRRGSRTDRGAGRRRKMFSPRRTPRGTRAMTELTRPRPADGNAERLSGRRRGVGRPARCRPDARATATHRRAGELCGRRRARHGRRRGREPLFDRRYPDHRVHGDPAPPSEPLAADARDRAGGRGGAAARARHHRQPGLHLCDRTAGARPRSNDPDRRVCLAVGLGVAAWPGAGDAELYRSHPGTAAVRARGA